MLPRGFIVTIVVAGLCGLAHSLIVPQEVPSILSLVYSNIPPIRKGTDSRLGFGFRLGEHADFQVVVELGPQKETRPIKEPDAGFSSKRQANPDHLNSIRRNVAATSTPSYLMHWSNDFVKKKKSNTKAINNRNTTRKKNYLLTNQMISESSLKQLQELYRLATTTPEIQPIIVEDTTNAEIRGQESKDVLTTEGPPPVPKERKTKGEITEELMDVSLTD